MASKLGKALGYSMDLGSTSSDDEGDASDAMDEPPASEMEPKAKDNGGSAEVLAMKMFEKATSPEAKVSALKAFLEACGCMTGSGDSY